MTTKAILSVCFLGAIGSLVIGLVGLGWGVLAAAEDVVVFPLVVGPYAVLAFLAWWRRCSYRDSVLLLAVAILIAAYGFWSFGVSSYRRHFDPYGGMAMDLSPLVVPALQWLAVTILAAVFGAAAVISSKVSKP